MGYRKGETHEEAKQRWREESKGRNYRRANKRKLSSHLYYEANREKIKKKTSAYYQLHKAEHNLLTRRRRQKIKTEVLAHYGNGQCACVKCGFSDIRALSIDHIAGGGLRHRREIGGFNLCEWLKIHNYPDGYQTLCMNCQFIKRHTEDETGWNLKNNNQLQLKLGEGATGVPVI